MNICFIAWERFGVGGVSRVLTRIMNALCREHEISVYCLRRPPLENAYGLDLENIRFFHHEMNVYEKMRRSVMDRARHPDSSVLLLRRRPRVRFPAVHAFL